MNDNNTKCNLDSILKVVPIAFKFEYITPEMDINLNSDSNQNCYYVKTILEGGDKFIDAYDLKYDTPYVLSGTSVVELS
jgi:hypothetical protein